MTQTRPSFRIEDRATPIITTALHAGHGVRSDVAGLMILSESDRLREEDPFTDHIADIGVSRIVAECSRFEVDLNRERDRSVYLTEDQAWGLQVWREPVSPEIAEESRRIHDEFYASTMTLLDAAVERYGCFVVLDIHSYNHRRSGPLAAPADPSTDPEINLGTESIHERFRPVSIAFTHAMADAGYDVRLNVKFRGGNFVRWVNAAYDGVGCALAIEFKKTFMDEWTGLPDGPLLERARAAVSSAALAIDPLLTGSRP